MTETTPILIGRMAVIDDAEFDQMMYRRIISRSGMVGDLLTFLSAEDAFAYLTSPGRKPIDVILLDVNMPGMSGFDFLDRATTELAADLAKIVIVMLTTSLNERDVSRARQYDVVKGYLHKPLEASDLTLIASYLPGGPPVTQDAASPGPPAFFRTSRRIDPS